MAERPILFSAPMVRSILDGSKTQTRRIVKSRYEFEVFDAPGIGFWPHLMPYSDMYEEEPMRSPYGQPGDRLWVRETFLGWYNTADNSLSHVAAFKADGYELEPGERWVPSLHMPRRASRILLEVTGVRVERLQDISEEDAIAEGVEFVENNFGNGPAYCDYRMARPEDTAEWFSNPVDSYRTLWESINGPGSWEANPWVWVVEFKRIDAAALKQAA